MLSAVNAVMLWINGVFYHVSCGLGPYLSDPVEQIFATDANHMHMYWQILFDTVSMPQGQPFIRLTRSIIGICDALPINKNLSCHLLAPLCLGVLLRSQCILYFLLIDIDLCKIVHLTLNSNSNNRPYIAPTINILFSACHCHSANIILTHDIK